MPTPDQRPIRSRGRAAPLLILIAIQLALIVPVVATGAGGSNEAADQDGYHLPIIRTMLEQWRDAGRVDIVRYQSATSPGYHLVMAWVLHATGRAWAMNTLNTAIGIGLVVAVYLSARRCAGAWGALTLTLPLALNPYVLGASVWLTTDNAGLLFVALALGGSALAPFTPGRGLRLGLYGLLAVAVRQIHVWVAAPIGLAGLLASPLAGLAPAALRRYRREPGRWACFAGAAAGAALPVAMLGVFVWLWGGLIPVSTGEPALHSHGMNPATFAFGLALTGALGVFFVPLAWSMVRPALLRDPLLWAGGLIGLLCAVAVPTAYSWPQRGGGWLWWIVQHTPALRERSLLIAGAAPVGACVLVVLYRRASGGGRRVPALLLLLGLLGWLCAQSANSMAWQRYFEPITLMGLAWLASLGVCGTGVKDVKFGSGDCERTPAWAWAGPLALAACEMLVSAATLYREAVTDLLHRP